MTLFVDGKRVITNAKGAVVRAKTRNYTNHKLNSAKEYDSICYSEELVDYCTNYQLDGYYLATHLSYFPQSHGDEGTGGGVRSGTVGGKGKFVTHSKSTCIFHPDGRKGWIIREGDLVVTNNGNSKPTPIEYLEGYGGPKFPEPSLRVYPRKPTENYMTHVVRGHKNISLEMRLEVLSEDKNGELQPRAGTQLHFHERYQQIELDQRYTFEDLPEEPSQYGLAIPNHWTGDWYVVPYPNTTRYLPKLKPNAPLNPLKSFQPESDQSVMIRPVANYQVLLWAMKKICYRDFSDIFRLSRELRHAIYKYFIHHKLTKRAADLSDIAEQNLKSFCTIEDIEYSQPGETIPTLEELVGDRWHDALPLNLQIRIKNETNMCMVREFPDGFMYIFVDGYLWRELRVALGLYTEVDLRTPIHKRETCTHVQEEGIILPAKISGHYPKVEIAYSEQQWTWERLEYYGGLAPDDIRRVQENKIEVSEEEAQQRRSKRFVPVELKHYVDEDPDGLFYAKGHQGRSKPRTGGYTQYPPKRMVLSCAKSSRFKFYSVRRYLHSSIIKFKSEEFCFAQCTNKLSECAKLGKYVRHRDSSRMGRLSANHNWLW
jgi:hypothetical protein